MEKRDLALDLFKTFKTGVTRTANKPAPTPQVGKPGDPELIGGVLNNLISNHINTIVYIADFMVNTDGQLTNVILSNKINPSLDKVVMKIFTNPPGWTNAMHNNRKIPFMHRQAIILSPPLN